METVKREFVKTLSLYSKSNTILVIGLVLLFLGYFADKTEAIILSITACVLFLIAIVKNVMNLDTENIFEDD